MGTSGSRLTFVVVACLLAVTALAETPEQIEADRLRGQNAGYNACRTVCRPTVPMGNQTSAGYASGWITGCTQAGGLTAACQQNAGPNPGSGRQTQPPVNTTPLPPTNNSNYRAGETPTPPTPDDPPVTAQEAVAFIRSHPELVPKAQEIVRKMEASGKTEKEIELAIRRFVADNRVTIDTPPSRNQNAKSGAQIQPLTSDEIKQMIAQNPELKKQMQDYALDLQHQGKSNEEVLAAVYQRLNEIHAEQVRAKSPTKTPQEFQSGDIGRQNAQDVQQRNSSTVQGSQAGSIAGYQADRVRRDRAQSVRETRAQDVQAIQAQDIQEYRAEQTRREITPDTRQESKRSNSGANSTFMHTFGLAVPGVAYSFDNYATNTRTNVVATGTVTRSAVRINPDHTYDWNSAWDGRLIHGRWTEWDGGIRLIQAQEGKDWLMHPLTPPGGKATVVLYTDSVTYHGTPLD